MKKPNKSPPNSSTKKTTAKSVKPKSAQTKSAKKATSAKSSSKKDAKNASKSAKKNAKQSAKKNAKAQQGFPNFADADDPAVVFARDIGHTRGFAPEQSAFVAGLDEAGRGPLAGPVVAAACVLPNPVPACLQKLNDSKQLTPEERDELFPLILEHAIAYGVSVVESVRIDEINILRASLAGMAEALEKCEAMLQTKLGVDVVVHGAVIDGNMKAPLPERVSQRTVIGGDAKSRPIMAASILAKVTRDRRMIEEHARFPGYGFDAHKGYGTPQHLKALAELGPCPLHRRSFEPVRIAEDGDMAALHELELNLDYDVAGGE